MKLKELRSEGPLGPWRATVAISALTGHKAGRLTSLPYENLFQVTASWVGPPPAFSANRGATNVTAQDVVMLKTYSDALRVALEAADKLRAGEVPDLRAIAGGGSVSTARAFA